MPKQPGGISKSDRMHAIVDLLNRAGMLEKQEINARIASHFDIEPETIDRALYRDLNELVDSGKIKVCSKDSIGRAVNPELDEIKNFKNYWFTEKHSPFEITGIGFLKEHGFNLILHSSLQEYIKCVSTNDFSKLTSDLIIPTRKSYLGINISPDIIPLNLFLMRAEELTDSFKDEFFKKIGKRSVILQIPNNWFSRFQGDINKPLTSVIINVESVIQNSQKRSIRIKELVSGGDLDLVSAQAETRSLTGLITSDGEFEVVKEEIIDISSFKHCHVKVGDFDFVIKGNKK
jgi:hypothetical protein